MELVETDVTQGVYDDYRQIMVIPKGLTIQEQSALILQLMHERR